MSHSAENDACTCESWECNNPGTEGCYFGPRDEVKEAAGEDAT